MAFDLLVKNGMIVDGSGLPRYRGDIGVKDGKIAEIGRISGSAKETLDAEGHVVSPGFVDGPKVMNGASDLIVEVLGDKGRHARSAVGAGSLPRNVAVEVDAVFELA